MAKTETIETKQPAFLAELLEAGSVTITAKSRDELAAMVAQIPAGTRYMCGAIGKNLDSGEYIAQLDLIK